MRQHERIAEKHDAAVERVNAPILAVRGGEVYRLAWTENAQGRWNTEDRPVVRWAAYDASGDWQGTFTRRRDAVETAATYSDDHAGVAFDPNDYADVAYHIGLA